MHLNEPILIIRQILGRKGVITQSLRTGGIQIDSALEAKENWSLWKFGNWGKIGLRLHTQTNHTVTSHESHVKRFRREI